MAPSLAEVLMAPAVSMPTLSACSSCRAADDGVVELVGPEVRIAQVGVHHLQEKRREPVEHVDELTTVLGAAQVRRDLGRVRLRRQRLQGARASAAGSTHRDDGPSCAECSRSITGKRVLNDVNHWVRSRLTGQVEVHRELYGDHLHGHGHARLFVRVNATDHIVRVRCDGEVCNALQVRIS